jgi:hypothetical protein
MSGNEEEVPLPGPAPEQADSAPVVEDESPFSSGEGMVALGGAIVALVWLVFELALRDYFISTVVLVLALIAVILPRMNRDFVEKIAPLGTLMKMVGYLLALAGLLEILDDLRFSGFDDGFTDIVGALGSYAGYAIAFLGARSIED